MEGSTSLLLANMVEKDVSTGAAQVKKRDSGLLAAKAAAKEKWNLVLKNIRLGSRAPHSQNRLGCHLPSLMFCQNRQARRKVVRVWR